MHQSQRHWHVLKHMQSDVERWWQLDVPFTQRDALWFEKEAIDSGIVVWFPRQDVGEQSESSRAAWLRNWPDNLRQELHRLYHQCYRPYTEGVMCQTEDDQTGMYYDQSQGKRKALLLLDRQGVLVVLRVLGRENELLWVSTYRALPPQKRLPSNKKWRKLVRSLREASLY